MVKQLVAIKGSRYVMVVRPLDWYAGKVGTGAVVEDSSSSAVYVMFDGGVRESFPPGRFAEYFQPEDTLGAVTVARQQARTPSGKILTR